jgi:hypothetical protein
MLMVNQLHGFSSGSIRRTKSSASGEWNGATGGWTFSGDDIVNTAGNAWIRSNDAFHANFSVSFTGQAMAAATNGAFGFYPISMDGTFDQSNAGDIAGLADAAGIYHLHQGASIRHANSEVATLTFNAGDVFLFERIGGVVTLKENGVLRHTYVATSSGGVRLFTGTNSGAGALDIDNISWTFDI